MGPSIGASPAPWIAFCARDPGRAACGAPAAEVTLTPALEAELAAVQQEVNASYVQRPDPGVGDDWRVMDAVPAGDCEDFALTKRDMLIRRGWPAGALHVGICFNRTQPVDGENMHAVLTVDTDRGTRVLGNLRDGVLPWAQSECRDWVMRSDTPNWRWVRDGLRVPLRGVANPMQ
jgi:predicted transglutaminase-like cysteine proteinase